MRWKRTFSAALLLAAICSPACNKEREGIHPLPAHMTVSDKKMKERWVFSFGYSRNEKSVEKIKRLIDTAATHNMNGMVLSTFGLDKISKWKAKDFELLKDIVDYAETRQIEIIPTGLSVGYGGALGHDRNFSAALPASIQLRAMNGRIAADHGKSLLANGGLEDHKRDRFKGYDFNDKPGKVSFADQNADSGQTCIRFENFGKFEHGNARISQKVKVRPGRMYRFSLRLKTDALKPVSGLKLMVYSRGRSLAASHPNVKSSQDWTTVTLDYINKDTEEVSLYAGIWQGKSGRFWFDDLEFVESGDMGSIVRREGTPLSLKSKDRDVTFKEGDDFEPIKYMHNLPSLRIPTGSKIKDGEALELSCYKSPYVSHSWGKQTSLCMSNPKLYAYWEEEVQKLYSVMKFKRFLLAMDEIRNGGGCKSCRDRGISMAEILGDCFTKQYKIFKSIDPEIEVITWSDMLDPAHNARNNYYGVVGDFTGSWKYVPKDIVMMCWHHKIRNKSLAFFEEKGFATMGAAYYDAADLTGSHQWLEILRQTPKSKGIMYTTWQKKYDLLPDFGDLVSE